MSEQQPGPGWWQASDGRWYAPETHPDYVPLPPPPSPPQATTEARPRPRVPSWAWLLLAAIVGAILAAVPMAFVMDRDDDSNNAEATFRSKATTTQPALRTTTTQRAPTNGEIDGACSRARLISRSLGAGMSSVAKARRDLEGLNYLNVFDPDLLREAADNPSADLVDRMMVEAGC